MSMIFKSLFVLRSFEENIYGKINLKKNTFETKPPLLIAKPVSLAAILGTNDQRLESNWK